MLFFRKSFILLVVVMMTLPSGVWAEEPQATDALENIQQKVAQALKRAGARSADWGVSILDPDDKRILTEVNPDSVFLPASVIKMVTTAAATERLGPDFRYCTGVYASGALYENGVLDGDIILVGRGDPNLLNAHGGPERQTAPASLAETIKGLGIREITGDVVGDDSYFSPSGRGRTSVYGNPDTTYGAPVTALSINDNIINVTARASKSGKNVDISIEPRTGYFRIRNLAEVGKSGDKQTLSIRLLNGSNSLVISGILPSSNSVTQAVVLNKPAETVAAVFKEELERRGIKAKGGVRAVHYGGVSNETKESWVLLAEYQSSSLIHSIEIINKRSQNLHAEMLLRTLGAEIYGVGSDGAGLTAVNSFLVDAGIHYDGIRINDGCGLSRENFLTPRFQTAFLEFLLRQPYFNLFFNTLAVSGTDGTLTSRLSANYVKGAIHAKTGTLNGVATLSGYISTRSGRNLVFCIFANRVTETESVKKTIDEICSLFATLY